jgi:carbon starvation protein
MRKLALGLFWTGVSLLGAATYGALAFRRGEPLNSSYLIIAAVCTYAIGYRFYSKWIETKALGIKDRRATPCEIRDDGRDFVRTNPWIVFGHHFAAISGPGPLVGPVLAAQFGYLPGTLWILIGCVLGGAVQDLVILFCSIRRDGKSLGQMVKEEMNTTAGHVSLVAILAIMVILLAVLGLVVVKALGESPWGVFTVGATIPIALLMGAYLRWWRIGKVLEASAMGIALLLLAVWGGKIVHGDPTWHSFFKLKEEWLAWGIIGYGMAASILPVWLLLAPRDYLSTFMKLGTIGALAVGVCLVLPDLQMPAVSRFVDGSGPVVPGTLFPFCFITIACGAISGFHSLIASGTTPKLITRERYCRPIAYGAMCLESMVAIMAMIAACTLEPGIYLSMNVKAPGASPTAIAENTVKKVQAAGFAVQEDQMHALAKSMGEDSLFGRTGGAATLAVGMAKIFSTVTAGRWLDLWYHFAIMFEALFILTTLDAGTRVGRYILQDLLGSAWKPLGDTRHPLAGLLASGLMVGGWGYFLIQGVRDPEGGVKALWPLFGIANQMLAAIALCLATTVLLKMQLHSKNEPTPPKSEAYRSRPWLALVTLVPLAWLVTVTLTAGFQKLFHEEIRPGYAKIGFLQIARDATAQIPSAKEALSTAERTQDSLAITAAKKKLRELQMARRTNLVDAAAAGLFLCLATAILSLSVLHWIGLLAGKRSARLQESPAVWLPETSVGPKQGWQMLGVFALAGALARELSGEAELERTTPPVATSASPEEVRQMRQNSYLHHTEHRYRSIRRCC